MRPSVSLGVFDQLLSETLLAMSRAHDQRAKQGIGAVELQANDADRCSRRTGIKEMLHVIVGEIGRWQRCTFQEADDVRAAGRLMNHRLHDHATFLRLTLFGAEAGLHAIAQESPLRLQQFSVR